ncbi:uncharacterized protein FYW23_005938 isoform 6-T15 [Sylvia borin]
MHPPAIYKKKEWALQGSRCQGAVARTLSEPGKQETKCERKTHDNTSIFPPFDTSLCDQLTARTRGSAGMDVSTSIPITMNSLQILGSKETKALDQQHSPRCAAAC